MNDFVYYKIILYVHEWWTIYKWINRYIYEVSSESQQMSTSNYLFNKTYDAFMGILMLYGIPLLIPLSLIIILQKIRV